MKGHIFSQKMYLLNFWRHAAQHSFYAPKNDAFQNVIFLVHKIFTFYIMDALKFNRPAPGQMVNFDFSFCLKVIIGDPTIFTE
jgi:hypothetical protein